MCEVWKDNRYVARHGDHGVAPVDWTLADMASRMSVNICDYLKLVFSAVTPQGGVATSMEGDRPRLTSIWIEVVIAYECRNSRVPICPTA